MPSPEFDVFLSHNSRDKNQVKELAKLLRARGLKCWLDVDNLVPGEMWQRGLEKGLVASATVAACIGPHKMGRWQDPEMQVALDLAQGGDKRILPILLPGASDTPELSAFLKLYGWVDLRGGFDPSGIDRVVWGITGKRPLPRALPTVTGDNPFGQVGPIQDTERFVGRDGELNRLRRMLQHGSAVILGPGKMGKTSLMLRVAREWDGEVLGPFNFQGCVGEADFLQQLAKALRAEEVDWQCLREHLESRRVLLLLDRIDAAPKSGVGSLFFTRIRAVQNTNPSFTVLGSARLPLSQLYPDVHAASSPPFDLVQPFQLGELKLEDAQLLLEHPWAPNIAPFEDFEKNRLLATAGLHPFRLQRAAFHYFESRQDQDYAWHERWQLDLGSML